MGIVATKLKTHILVAVIIWPVILFAQTDSSRIDDEALPLLYDNYFVPNLLIQAPFITTFLSTGVGGGTSLSEIPISLLGGKLNQSITAENTFVAADVQVQIKVKDWLATWLHYQANARVGSNTPTILAHGVTSITGFEFGWLLLLWQSERNQLSGSIFINNITVSTINLPKFYEDIIDSVGNIIPTLTKENNPLSGGIGLHYAHAFNDVWGLQAFLKASYGESMLREDESVWKFDTGLMGVVNFNHHFDVPIGMTFGYTKRRFALFESKQEDTTDTFFLEVTYTHHYHYNIGLNMSYLKLGTPLLLNITKLEFLSSVLTLVYYF